MRPDYTFHGVFWCHLLLWISHCDNNGKCPKAVSVWLWRFGNYDTFLPAVSRNFYVLGSHIFPKYSSVPNKRDGVLYIFWKKKVASNKFRNFPINMQFSSIKITIITTNMFIPTNTFIPTNQHVYSNQPTRLFGTLGKQGHRRYQHLTYPFLLKFVFICYSSVPIWL
jgi:hypothetical protein